MLLGGKLQHSMQNMGNKINNPIHMGNKINSHYKRNYLQIQPKPISHSQSSIERSHNNH
jgi:hypothetical protein